MSKHKSYDPGFKAKAVLEVLQGQKTKAQICDEYSIAPSLLAYWKERFIERSPQLFITRQVNTGKRAHIAELEQIVDQLNLKLTALKNYESINPPSKKGKP